MRLSHLGWSCFGFLFFSGIDLAIAQNIRPSIEVNSNLTDDARGVGASSSGDLSAICWNEGGSTNQVFVSTSNGRGLTWTVPQRVDNDSFTKTTQQDSVHVVENRIYVVWEADSGLFFSRSTDAGLNYSTPLPIDIGPGNVRDWRFTVSPDPSGDHLYVLASTAVTDEDLFLTASHNDGASFSSAVLVPAVGASGDVDALAVAATGLTIHIVWDDNRSGSDTVYYQRSIDGGATYLPNDVELGDAVGVEDSQDPLNIDVAGSIVAVAWNEEPTGSGDEVIQANVSVDGGVTFNGPITVGDYNPAIDDTDEGDVAIDDATGNVIVTWEDNRSGTDEAYVATSTDGGLTFLPDSVLSSTGAQNPALVTSDGRLTTLVFWESVDFPSTAQSRFSRDGGLSWSPLATVSDNAGFVDFPTATYNDRYNNYLHSWVALDGSTLRLYAGGYRPQTLTPNGWNAGPTTLNFDVLNFDPGSSPAWVLLSAATGSTKVSGRDLGLLADDLFVLSLNLNTLGLFSTGIDANGNGSTVPLNVTLPAGVTIQAVAIGLNFSTSDVTDVVEISIQ